MNDDTKLAAKAIWNNSLLTTLEGIEASQLSLNLSQGRVVVVSTDTLREAISRIESLAFQQCSRDDHPGSFEACPFHSDAKDTIDLLRAQIPGGK